MICTKLKERRPLYDANLILGERAASSDPTLLDGSHDLLPFSKLFVFPHRFSLLEQIFLQTATPRQSPSIYNQSCSCWLFVIFYLRVSELRTLELHFMLATSFSEFFRAWAIQVQKHHGHLYPAGHYLNMNQRVVAVEHLHIKSLRMHRDIYFIVG